MESKFYNINALNEGLNAMVSMIKEINEDNLAHKDKLVLPNVQPGFLRIQMPLEAPSQPSAMQDIIRETKQKIYPGIMNWGSNKYFGYFPFTISFTNIIADVFASSFSSPAFIYACSPAHTELQNIVMDWTVKALDLPQKFLLKNSGGGTFLNSITEAHFNVVHAAKRRKMQELGISKTDPRILKLVAYYSQFCHSGAWKALYNKEIPYIRVVPCRFCNKRRNYVIDVEAFRQVLEKDLQKGLIPFWYGSVFGSTFSCADDLEQELLTLCQKHKIWIGLDAAYLGCSWYCEEMRPDKKLLEIVDSVMINFGKTMFLPGGAILFVSDKNQYAQSFSEGNSFSFFKNQFSGENDVVDYRNWSIGLQRKNNAIRLFYLYKYFGIKQIQTHIHYCVDRAQKLVSWIEKQSQLFSLFSQSKFGLVCFQIKSKDGKKSNQLTERIANRVKNTAYGYLTPAAFKDEYIIRIAIGNPNATFQILQQYWNFIVKIAKEETVKQAS